MENETRRIKRILREQERRHKVEKNSAEPWHSRAYHREFEGYAEREVQTENGRTKIERIYVGNYYELDATDQRRRLLKWTHVVFALGASVFFLMGATARVAANYSRLTALFQAIETLALAWLLIVGVRNLLTPVRMRIRQYKDSSRAVLLWTRIAAVCAGVCCLLTLVLTLIHAREGLGAGLLCALYHALVAALVLLSYYIEAQQNYRVIPSGVEITEDMTVL